MAIKYATALRENRALYPIYCDILRILTGTPPANVAAAQTGTLLAEITLPASPFSGSGGVLNKTGVWSAVAAASGVASYFRILSTTGPTPHIQGTITATGGGGDMTMDSTTITAGQTVTVITFTLTEGNA